MSEKNGKVCCNCRHNIRKGEIGSIDCYCDIDNRYISYIDTFEHWCRQWAKEYIEIKHECTFSLPFDIDVEGEE